MSEFVERLKATVLPNLFRNPATIGEYGRLGADADPDGPPRDAMSQLSDLFHTIKEITVPAWKRQFMLALGLNEQRNAVQLANQIDDTTNDLLRRNAELLHRNSVETARANQRLVIDVETLRHVQGTLIKTVEDVIKIQQDGVQQRRNAQRQIEAMRKDLQAKLTRSDIREAA